MWKVNFPNTVKYNTVSASLHLSEKVKWAGGIFFLFLSPIQQNTFLGQQCHERHRIILVIWQLYFKHFHSNIDRTESGLCLLLSNQRTSMSGVTVGNILEGFDECAEKEYTCSWPLFQRSSVSTPRSSCLRWSSVDSQSICGNLLCTLHIAPLAKGIMFLFRN